MLCVASINGAYTFPECLTHGLHALTSERFEVEAELC